MIIRKIPNASDAQAKSSPNPNPSKGKTIHMWERVRWLGKTFNIPLDEEMKPMGDLAIEDVADLEREFVSRSVQVAPTYETPEPGNETERLVADFVRKMLATEGDATTYQIYEAVLLRLQESRLLDHGESVDLIKVLSVHFRHYEFQGERGELLRKWTVRKHSKAERDELAQWAFENWDRFVQGSSNSRLYT